jgi:hypothetical protein
MRFVRATDPFRRPLTIHPTAIQQYTARHATDDPALLDFDMLQTPHGQREAADVALRAVRESYAAQPVMPVVDGEASYERLSDRLPTDWTRAMFWICMTSGAAGHTYGANGIWQCNRREQPHGASPHGGNYGVIPWDEAMNLPGSSQLAAGKRFFERFPWQRFAPHPEWVAWLPGASSLPALGSWIWYPEGDPRQDAPVAARCFRRTFDLAADRPWRRARLRVGADDRFTAWLNGREIGAGAAWNDPAVFDVTASIHAGRNVLAIRAENAPGPENHNPAGLIAGLEIEFADGTTAAVLTDADCLASRDQPPGWLDADFEPNGWRKAAVLGAPGVAPWGEFRPREAFPPLAAGLDAGARVYYMLDPKPVRLQHLVPGRSYDIQEFDPVTGVLRSRGRQVADASGSLDQPAPDHGHDWVLAVTPAE